MPLRQEPNHPDRLPERRRAASLLLPGQHQDCGRRGQRRAGVSELRPDRAASQDGCLNAQCKGELFCLSMAFACSAFLHKEIQTTQAGLLKACLDSADPVNRGISSGHTVFRLSGHVISSLLPDLAAAATNKAGRHEGTRHSRQALLLFRLMGLAFVSSGWLQQCQHCRCLPIELGYEGKQAYKSSRSLAPGIAPVAGTVESAAVKIDLWPIILHSVMIRASRYYSSTVIVQAVIYDYLACRHQT